jgi:DNA-binding transcriptional LysR family regulator
MNEFTQVSDPLDSRQLNAFVTLIQTGSFTETARRLCLSQSAISHSIRALESDIGCRLLTKMGKTIAPTQAGEALLRHAKVGLGELAIARQELEKLKNWKVRRLRLGAGSLVNCRILPTVLVELRRRHPHLVVTVKTVHPSRQTEDLRNGELDFVISEEHAPHSEMEFTPLFESPFQIVLPPTHRWVAQQQIPRDELFVEPCVLPERLSPTGKLIERYFSRDKKTLNSVMEVDNLDTIKEMVKAGMGIGILPAWITHDDLRLGALFAFAPGRRNLSLAWGLHRCRGRPADLIQNDFQTLCATTVKELRMVSGSASPASAG